MLRHATGTVSTEAGQLCGSGNDAGGKNICENMTWKEFERKRTWHYAWYYPESGLGSSVSTATGYGLDGPGSNPGGGDIFRTCPYRPWSPHSLLYNGYRVVPGVKSGRGVTLTSHPLLVLWSRKSRAIPVLPCGPYDLYRASVPVQGCTLPLLSWKLPGRTE